MRSSADTAGDADGVADPPAEGKVDGGSTRLAEPVAPMPFIFEAALPAAADSLKTGALLAAAGGFLDGFTYVGRGHVFANAMTGNVVLLGVESVAGAWSVAARHLIPILMFLLGIWAARALHLPVVRRRLSNPYAAVLGLELTILFVLMLLPQATPDFWITASVAFSSSMQVQTFRSVRGQTYNSTFTTGNLRMLSVGVFDWLLTEDRGAPGKARIFAVICGCFLAGASLGGWLVSRIGNWALGVELAILSAALWLVVGRCRSESVS